LGTGFEPQEIGDDRFGLHGIRERARLLGGNTNVEVRRGQGRPSPTVLPRLCWKD